MLSRREAEILKLLSHGLTPDEIADRLYRSRETIRKTICNIKAKLQLQKASELTAYYWCDFFGTSLEEQKLSLNKMTEVASRVREVRDYFCNGSNTIFANMLGEKSSTTSNWVGGKRNIGIDVIEKILSTFPSINSAWLLTGEGEMLKTESHTSAVDSRADELLNIVSSQQKTIERLTKVIENLTRK